MINDGSNNISHNDIEYIRREIPSIKYIDGDVNYGKGNAIRVGAKESDNDYLIFTDIDFPYTIESLKSIVNGLKMNSDVILGYRDNTYYDNVPMVRKMISVSFRGFLKYILRWQVTDTQCGLKGFNKKGKEVLLSTRINRYLFDAELIQKCQKKPGLVVTPVNVYLREGMVFSTLDLKILLKEVLNLLRILNPFFKKFNQE